MFHSKSKGTDWTTPFDVAVVVQTTLRPSLERAVRSVYDQDLDGRVQVLVGVDVADGDEAMLDRLAEDCPARMAMTVCALPYSTSVRHGGLYSNRFGGALRSILTLAANSQRVAYLDDDNWWMPDHLSSLVHAIEGQDWAFSRRIFADPETGAAIALDDWESVGPGAGAFAKDYGGFVDTSSLMIDKIACHDVVDQWCLAGFADGSGEDRMVLKALLAKPRSYRSTGRATGFYTMQDTDANHATRLHWLRDRGIVTPSELRAGRIGLAEIAADLPGSDLPQRQPRPLHSFLRLLVVRLKPREIVLLGNRDADFPLSLSDSLSREGIGAQILVAGRWDEAAYNDVVERFGSMIRAWPPGRGDLSAHLAERKVTVDLVCLDDPAPPVETAFALLRRGGIVLGPGEPAQSVKAFAETAGAELLPVDLDDLRIWLLQKG
jgi:hypothetical protein